MEFSREYFILAVEEIASLPNVTGKGVGFAYY
jgi:hypothetical protein